MPYINFINVNDEIVNAFSRSKLDQFSEIANAPLENICVIQNNSNIVNQQSTAFINILWMPRSSEMEKMVHEMFVDFLKDYNYNKVCVYFNQIEKEHYYVGECE